MAAVRGISRLVVAVDGSEHSLHAVQWAIRMARGMSSEVVAVFAVRPPTYFDTGYSAPIIPVEYDQGWREAIKKEFEEEWCKPLREAGVGYRAVMRDGRPASVVNEVAEEVDADVVLVGRRGRGGVAELLLGSVSHEVVLQSRRPVLVVSSAPNG